MKIRNLLLGLVALSVLSACKPPVASSEEEISSSEPIPTTSGWVAPEPVRSPKPADFGFNALPEYDGTYWNDIDFNLRGEALKTALNQKMWANFVKVDYSTALIAVREMDKDPKDAGKVLSIYDLKSHNANVLSTWNREHAFPQSKLADGDDSLRAASNRKNISSDVANLFAADWDLNEVRSNNSYGEWNYEDDPETFYPFTTVNTANERTDSILRRGYFSPTRMVRGEIARSQLYMLLMYPANCSITENFMIQTMLRWDLDYAPTIERDGQRQAGIEKYQNTRNPFIDNRKLSCYIWGDFNQWTQDICATVI